MMGSQYIGSEKKFVKCQVSKFPIYLGQIVQGLKRSEFLNCTKIKKLAKIIEQTQSGVTQTSLRMP